MGMVEIMEGIFADAINYIIEILIVFWAIVFLIALVMVIRKDKGMVKHNYKRRW